MKANKLNSRQHRFALNILAGMRPQQAFVNAGYSDNPASAICTPYTLQSDSRVSKFIQEHRDKIATVVVAHTVDETVLSQAEKRQILADIARVSLADHLDDDGNIKLNRAKAKALKEYYKRTHTDRDGNPISTSSLKLVDVISAIQEDNKMMGHYAPRRSLVATKVVIELRPYRRLKEGEEEE